MPVLRGLGCVVRRALRQGCSSATTTTPPADERRRAASRAGKSKTPHMVRELHETLAQVTEDVIGGQLTLYAGMSVA